MRRPTQPVWYSLIAVLVSILLATVTTVVLLERSAREAERAADRATRESEQRWCAVVTTLDDAYRSTPPTTETGRQLARDIGELRREFHCPQRPE